jgi:UTP--glucose-1-phosphate uridylyltransferase
MGRYVLTPEIFEILGHTAPGRNHEIQLTDGMRELCLKDAMIAVDFMGERYDTGNPADYVKTFLEFALEDPDVGAFTRAYLLERAQQLRAETENRG